MIPKKIFQTSKTKTIPEKCSAWTESWLKYNPDYEYVHYSNDECAEYVRSYFPEYFNDYCNFPCDINRIDFVRFLYLYREGGIYADIDFECLKPFDTLLEENKEYDIILGSIPPNEYYTIPNAIMLSKPNIDFWLVASENVINNFKKNKIDHIEAFSGPVLLERILKYEKNNYKIKITTPDVLYPYCFTDKCSYYSAKESALKLNSYAIHYWIASWKKTSKLEMFIYKNKKQ